MPILNVGATQIPYRIRRSTAAKRKRIIVTPEDVEVIAPAGQADAEIAEFIHTKRRWVYDKREQLREQGGLDHPFPSRFATGGKILYRGRRLRLVVELVQTDSVVVEYRNGFHVRAPAELGEAAREAAIEAAVRAWMCARVQADADGFARHYADKLGVEPAGVRVKDQRHLWGSCGADGVIRLNWQLAFAPKPVLAYAVVHELCHLRYRNHSSAFWRMVGGVLPEYEEMRDWLERERGWSLA
jgi:predicted metal-dependent hydrolase